MALDTLAVIPARYGSSRLPGKPLIAIAGVPLVLRVLRGVQRCRSVDRVIVATDDQRIADLVRNAGGEAQMTPELPSGGDRVAWVARQYPCQVVLNVQGDDPLVGPDMIDPLVEALRADPSISLALCVKEIQRDQEVSDPNIVKAVFSQSGRALYFSRSPIPYPRESQQARWFKHIGPYGWRRDLLLQFAQWPQTPLERTESLEMLRVLERGYPIQCLAVHRDTIEVDTPEDLARLEALLAKDPC